MINAKDMKRIYFLAFALLSTVSLWSQYVGGTITDAQGKAVEFANVVFLSLPDSAFVAGAVSGENGGFRLSVDERKGVLKVSCIGYATLYKECQAGETLSLQLQADAQLLDEVVVKGDLPKTRLKNGASITTVAGSVLEKAGTAENLLDRIPGVSAGGGSVSVFGRGVAEVYINGRKVRDSSELDQLSSDNIKSVEVINNPGARYAASVKAVVRITTKRAPGEGFGFSNRAYAGYNKDWTLLDQFNFNYRTGGFDLSGMLAATDGHAWSKRSVVQDTYLDKLWSQQMYMDEKEHSQSLYATISANYTFDSGHALGIRYNWKRLPRYDSWGTLDSDVRQDGEQNERLQSIYESASQETSHTLNLYYAGKAGDWNIDFNADALWNGNDTDGYTDERVFAPSGLETDTRQVNTFSRADNRLYAGKLVLSREWLGGELSLGGEYSHNTHGNDYVNPEGLLEDDHSEIREGSASGFVEYGRSFGLVYVLAGLRFEHVASGYYEGGTRIENQSKHYNDWFPSATVMVPAGDVQLSLSYASDIVRPSYHMLRGNIVYNNRYTYESGNPLLRPQVAQNLILNAVYDWTQLTLGYVHTKDAIVTTSVPYSDEDPSVALLTNTNAPAYNHTFASLSLTPVIGIWSPQFTAAVVKQWYRTDTPWGRFNLDKPLVSLSWENSLKLPGGFLLNADASWSSLGHEENTEVKRQLWSVNAMLYKGFLNDRLTLQLRATDLFNSTRSRSLVYLGSLRTFYTDAEPNSRSVSLTLRYKFNVAKSKYKGTGAGSSQKSRM